MIVPGKYARSQIDNYKSSLQKIVDQLIFCNYADDIGHMLQNNLAFIALQELATEQAVWDMMYKEDIKDETDND